MGHLPMASAQNYLLLGLTDYYFKWVVVEAYASVKDKDARVFVWKHIICQFGIPK